MTAASTFQRQSDSALIGVLRRAGVPERKLAAGETLFNEGDEAPDAFYVVEGAIRVVHIDEQRRSHTLGVVEAGELLGEAAFLSASRRSATAVAASDAVVLSVARGSLAQIVARTPEFTMFLIRLFSSRLRASNSATHAAELAGAVNRRVLTWLETDKKRMVRELQSSVLTPLAAVTQQIVSCRELSRSEPAKLLEAANGVKTALTAIAKRLDHQIENMSREVSQHGSVVEFLHHRLERIEQDTGVRLAFESPPIADEQIPPATRKSLLSLVDSAVSLACTVAKARAVQVQFSVDTDALRVLVADDGTAHDVAQFSAGKFAEVFGLYDALRARALLASGTLELAPRDGGGTAVTIILPLATSASSPSHS